MLVPQDQDSQIQLLIPKNDVLEPELSIVVPALNEQLTIGDFVDWSLEGIRNAGVKGEILIIDSSTDKTGEIALSKGARVLKTPKRGLGRAYIDALPFVRGKYMILGDCDCTYDFREVKSFVEKFHSGYEYIMGSRFKGFIEEGAMPPMHRYLGTPVTTWILNRIYSSRFSDINCGMRGIKTDAFIKMKLHSQSWEYASEMVLKSVHLNLKTSEVPIRFLKDRDGRLSHHKRQGWFSPWKAAWINLRAMFVYGPSFFLYRPGLVLLLLGLLLTLPLSFGPIRIGSVELSLYWMLLGLCLAVTGLQCTYMGILAQVIMDYSGLKTKIWQKRFAYDRSVGVSILSVLMGIALLFPLLIQYWKSGLMLPSVPSMARYFAVTGFFFIISGFMTFTFVLLLNAIDIRQKESRGN